MLQLYNFLLKKGKIMIQQLVQKVQYQLVNKAPKFLSLPSQLLPFAIQERCLQEVLTRIFAEAIEDGDLEFLQDKWLQVSISDLNLTWFISFQNEQFVIKESVEHVDVSFMAPINDLILVAGRKEDPDTLFFQRRLSIEGDTELGLEVKNLLDNIEFENLPQLAQQAIDHFSSFIKTAMAYQPTQSQNHKQLSI